MPLITEVKQLIVNIRNTRSKEDLLLCRQQRDTLDKKIRSSHDINELKQVLEIVSEQLAKIKQFAVPTGMAIGATMGGVGAYLTNCSFFGIAGASIAGAMVGAYTMVDKEEEKHEGGATNVAAFFLLKMLEQSLNQSIRFLRKQEEVKEQKGGNFGLRYRG